MKILTKGNYYGAKRSEIHVNGVVLSEYNYLAAETDWHFHENPYFMYVIQGDLYDINKKRKTTCPSGSLVFHNWQEPHQNTRESEFARGFHIEFERPWFDQKKWGVDLWEGSQLLENPELHHTLAKLYFEFKCQDAFSDLSIELLLMNLCEKIESKRPVSSLKEPSWIVPLKELLHDDHTTLSLQYLSEKLGVHPVHLSRTIPKYFSTTLGDYLRKQKIKQALSYLMNSNFSLTEISYICGFSDQSHFTRTFKLYFGVTPKAFRNRMSA